MGPVDLFLEQYSISYSQGGTKQLLVAGNLGLIFGGRIVNLSVGS